jgi:hypothetical protein
LQGLVSIETGRGRHELSIFNITLPLKGVSWEFAFY